MSPEWQFLFDTIIRWLPYVGVLLFVPLAVFAVRCCSHSACRNGPIQKSASYADEEFWVGDEDYLKKLKTEKSGTAMKTDAFFKNKSVPNIQNDLESPGIFRSVNLTRDNSGVASHSVQNKCSICKTIYSEGEDITTLPCTHKFHSNCTDDWFGKHTYCPECIRPNSISLKPASYK